MYVIYPLLDDHLPKVVYCVGGGSHCGYELLLVVLKPDHGGIDEWNTSQPHQTVVIWH